MPIDSVFHGFVWLINMQSDLSNGFFYVRFFVYLVEFNGFFVFFWEKSHIVVRGDFF